MNEIAGLFREGLMTFGLLGAPVLGAVLLVGLVVGVMQAATQVNEQSIGTVARLVTAIGVLVLAGSWMVERMAAFLQSAMVRMAGG